MIYDTNMKIDVTSEGVKIATFTLNSIDDVATSEMA